MPVKSCTSGGKSGHKWGDEGKCYTGPGSKAKAAKQGKAIKAQQAQAGLLNAWMVGLQVLTDSENNNGQEEKATNKS